MDNRPPPISRYRLSFTVGGLFSAEALVAAELYSEHGDWNVVRSALDAGNLLQARTLTSSQRRSREVVQRLVNLTDHEIKLLLEGTAEERGHLLWAAACRHYELIAEFAEEVVKERFLLLTPTLSTEHFESFVRTKSLWHEELQAVADSTSRKLRSTLYLMLREAGFLSETGAILPCTLSPRVTDALQKRTPSDLRFFPTAAGVVDGVGL